MTMFHSKSRDFWKNGTKERQFDSKFEGKVCENLEASGAPFKLTNKDRSMAYKYQRPVSYYHPDFTILKEDGNTAFIIEAKGRFMPEDRSKLLLVKQQNPEVDIRLLFYRPTEKINKGSGTTYSSWCEKHGFKWAKGPDVPKEWIEEVAEYVEKCQKELRQDEHSKP